MNRRDFLRLTGSAAVALGAPRLPAQTVPNGPGAIRFAVIGDFGETLADQIFPLDRVANMVRSWNPDFVVSVGDNNYVLGQASTIDVNIGKNFTAYIYPKTTEIPVEYPYPAGAPLYNRFVPTLGNHDYGDVGDDHVPSVAHVSLSNPYLQYFENAVRAGFVATPNTDINFADHAPGQTWERSLISGEVENYAAFSESENMRFYDVRLGTPSGPSSVHLFVFDSNPATPYGRYAQNRTIPNRDGSPSAFVEQATQGAWLQARLAASTATWKIVIFHHPPYNSAPGAATSQYEFLRWPFQAWGATAVITGHVHNYERLEMPDSNSNFEPVYGGPTIPYMVNGAGGFIPEQGFDPSFVIQGSKVRVAQYGAQLITADEDSINFLYFDIDGVLRDVRTIYADPAAGIPQVEFGGREFPVSAGAGTVHVPVTRLGDASAPLTVNYSTMDGSAIAGVNYQPASGLLAFAANEREKTIAITIEPPPTFLQGTVPWESLIFAIGLSMPDVGSVGFFHVASVIMVNTVDTPITNQDLFITQTYADLFQTVPTPAEIAAAKSGIGVLDLWLERAKWVYDLLISNYANEPVFPAVQVYSALILSDTGVLSGLGVPPSFPDLENGVSLYRGAATTNDALTTLSEAFNENILALLDSKVPGFGTDDQLFIETVYLAAILPLGSTPTQADIDYWLLELSGSNQTERSKNRNLMLGRIAAESFDPPPVTGMTAFNLTVDNQNEVLLSIIVAGLLRIQLVYDQFLAGYLGPAKIGGELAIIDHIYNLLQSADYAARFRVTSYEGYIDSVKGGLSSSLRLREVDPEGDGLDNHQEYSFAVNASHAFGAPVTDIDIQNDAGQQYALFSYRQAANIKRVEFLIQTSSDLVTWTVATGAIADGGGGYGILPQAPGQNSGSLDDWKAVCPPADPAEAVVRKIKVRGGWLPRSRHSPFRLAKPGLLDMERP